MRNSVQSEASYQKKLEAQIKQKSNFVYLYSDEATGYRNAVDQDLKILSKLKKKIPSLMLGGFGNLFDLEKGRSLYKSWDVGLYHDMTSSNDLVLLNQWHKQWGLYNICSEPNAPIKLCCGLVLYKLFQAGVMNIMEWHLNSNQNYLYFDLDGREADIAMLLTDETGKLFETYRYKELQSGLLIFYKLLALNEYLKNRKAPGLMEMKAKKWLEKLQIEPTFPVKKLLNSTVWMN